jgi:hypothetical protein
MEVHKPPVSDWLILHEMAHSIAMREDRAEGRIHGRRFMRIYMALVRRWMGKEAAADLRAACREHHVKWRDNGHA